MYRLSVLFIVGLLLSLFSCHSSKDVIPAFKHEDFMGAKPWNHERFQEDPDQFTFAITSDLYGGIRPGVFEVAIEQLNLLRPELIMTVGDLIDGGTEDTAQLNKEWREFDNKASKALAPLFHVGGNHDLTNTTMRNVWEQRHGKRYYHFVYKDVLFLVLDSEDYQEERMHEIYLARAEAIKILDGDEPAKAVHSQYYKMEERRTGEVGTAQNDYFKKVIDANPDVRWTFLFMHKPVWMREDIGGLANIEGLLSNKPYTLFNGHFHTYSHTDRHDRDYIMLGTTGGAQNAQSDMAFDHITLVTVTNDGPSIANLKLEGILDKHGKIPANGDKICFQASKCAESETEKK
jgi:hypothetical protein